MGGGGINFSGLPYSQSESVDTIIGQWYNYNINNNGSAKFSHQPGSSKVIMDVKMGWLGS